MRIVHSSLGDVVTDQLRRAIFEGAFKPGTHLIEQNLADEFGVSRGPIRDSLQQLQQEGLVQVLPRRGTIVAEISPQEMWEVYVVRGHLEGLAVKFAAPHWTPEMGERLAALLSEMEELGSDDWLKAIELDRRYHRLIVDASGNSTLIQLHRALDSKVSACFLAVKQQLGGIPADMAAGHRNLTEALVNRDFWRGEMLAIQNWTETGDRFRALASRQG